MQVTYLRHCTSQVQKPLGRRTTHRIASYDNPKIVFFLSYLKKKTLLFKKVYVEYIKSITLFLYFCLTLQLALYGGFFKRGMR